MSDLPPVQSGTARANDGSHLLPVAHLLGPFHGAVAVPSVTCCRCCPRRGHRCAGGVRQ